MAAKKPPANPVTQEAADKFSAYVKHWQDVLSLGDWRIKVSAVRSKRRDVMAEVYKIDLEQRMAVIRLGSDWAIEVSDTNLNEAALHEVLHIFNHELIESAKVPDQPIDNIRSVEHRIINVLERLLADKYRD